MIQPDSRYADVPVRHHELASGQRVAYLARRRIPRVPDPAPGHFALPGERPDNFAARLLRNPEHFWRLADARGVLDPRALSDLDAAR